MPITFPEADLALYAIVALLPLSALMVVVQVNPYHALVIRGILGAVAALVYALLGAADVALTEALVGTMLAITLYAVAVRSSLLMRLGIVHTTTSLPTPPAALLSEATQALEPPVLDPQPLGAAADTIAAVETRPATAIAPLADPALEPWLADLRRVLDKRHLRLELVPYPDTQSLQQAFREGEVHAVCTRSTTAVDTAAPTPESPAYQTQVRIRRLYDILQAELTDPADLTYTPVSDREEHP
ncbi:DUF4040 domain-containing protein [Trichothermofontia sp.]